MNPTDLPEGFVYAGREILGDLCSAEAREVLLTNGIGGYGSFTLANSLTRSYHGLLVAALRPPLDRTLLLTKLNETVLYHRKSYHLSTDRRKHSSVKKQSIIKRFSSTDTTSHALFHSDGEFPSIAGASLDPNGTIPPIWNPTCSSASAYLQADDAVSPHGFELQQSFHLTGTVPTFVYSFADALLEKKLWMKQGSNTVYVTYYLRRAVQGIELRLKALVNHRNHHTRTSATRPHFDYSANIGTDRSSVSVLFTTANQQYTTLNMKMSQGTAHLTNEWVTGFVLSEERMRGLPEIDDNLHVATFVVELAPGGRVTFMATAEAETDAITMDGEAELEMRFKYEQSLLQKFESARDDESRRLSQSPISANDSNPSLSLTAMPVSPVSSSGSFSGNSKRKPRTAKTYIKQLVLAADQFIISRAGGRSIVAGFHWFADWARDVRSARFPNRLHKFHDLMAHSSTHSFLYSAAFFCSLFINISRRQWCHFQG